MAAPVLGQDQNLGWFLLSLQGVVMFGDWFRHGPEEKTGVGTRKAGA